MALFGFDAFKDWEAAEPQLRFWCYVVLLGPALLCVAAHLLLQHIAWPQTRRMR